MSELVGDLQADKKYYQTNIALAASSLAAKTTALAAQLATAAASSGSYRILCKRHLSFYAWC
jgi:filamentous hemagglutinin